MSDSDPDYLLVELYDGSGVFANGVAPGTYPLTGDELNYVTCGLCVLVASENDDYFMATGGSVTLSSVAGDITGVLNNVTFEHVTISQANGYTSTPHPLACTSGIVNASFDTTIQ